MLAYWDSLKGVIPCRTTCDLTSDTRVSIQITANRKPYKKGEVLTVPRNHVWKRDGSFPLKGSYGLLWHVVNV